jgi:hypothetical protein
LYLIVNFFLLLGFGLATAYGTAFQSRQGQALTDAVTSAVILKKRKK